jgi:lipopolysaccharide/colanic/teichoic acid biosynthesis glycosyltransferase
MSEQSGAAQERWGWTQRTGACHLTFDLLCAGFGLVPLLPVFCVIAALIKLDDGGPIFYRQPRVGRNFQLFHLLKFRSMITGADRAGLLTAPGDRRVTRVGRYLRHYKLDELPQLFNVVKGEMQLVGARPEVARYVEIFRGQYAVLLRERPGITDPASLAYRHEDQIMAAGRVAGSIEEQYVEQILPAKLKLSLDYQKRRDFWSDLRILLQTILGLLA